MASVGVLAALAAAAPIRAEAPAPSRVEVETAFNAPSTSGGGAPSSITESLVEVLDSAARRSIVRAAVYYAVDDHPRSDDGRDELDVIARAIRRAVRDRQVSVRVLMESSHRVAGYARRGASDAVKDLRRAGAALRRCQRACYTQRGGIMHNKFVLLDRTTGGSPAVMQLSANWDNVHLRDRYHNDALVIRGDRSLYRGYRLYFDRLWALARCTRNCPATPPTQRWVGGGGRALWVFPGRGDPLLASVDAARCPETSIEIATGTWTATGGPRGRPLRMRQLLIRKHRQGCAVRVLVAAGQPIARAGYLDRRVLPGARCTFRRPVNHSKFLLLTYGRSAVPAAQTLWTGSQNLTHGGYRQNDEAIVRLHASNSRPVAHALAARAYRAHFDEVWGRAKPCPARRRV